MPSVMLLFRNTISVSTITEKKTEISMCSNLYLAAWLCSETYLPSMRVRGMHKVGSAHLSVLVCAYMESWRQREQHQDPSTERRRHQRRLLYLSQIQIERRSCGGGRLHSS